MRLFLFIYLVFVELELIFCCLHSEGIECYCPSDVIKCFGSIEDTFQIQQLFSNLSQIHSSGYSGSLFLNLTNLRSLSDIVFTGLDIKNLTLINGLQNVSDSFLSSSFSNLHTLIIQDNKIHFLASQPFQTLYNLVELHMESNEISEIKSEAFFNLSSLEFLSLSKNRLSKIDKNLLVNLPLIQTLLLNENNISSVSNIQAHSLSLIKLSAQDCDMTGFLEKNSLSGLSRLNFVDFSRNQIEGINSFALSSLSIIKELNLSKNSILFLEDNAFSGLSSLEVLDLSLNKISLIKTTAFNKLSNLLHLDLKENQLRAMLCDYTFDLHSLKKVDLRRNRIKTINAGTFLYSHNIQELFLEGNALDEADAIICSPLPNITIMFIDIGFESKNCEMPDPCGALLLNNEDDYEIEYDSDSNVTISDLSESTTKEMESFSSSFNTINPTSMETSSQSFETTKIESTLHFLSTITSDLIANNTDNSFLDTTSSTSLDDDSLTSTIYSGEFAAMETNATDIEDNFESTSELTTHLNELITKQTESSSISSTESLTPENDSALSTEDEEYEDDVNNTKIVDTTTETFITSHKASIIVTNYSLASKLCFRWALLNAPSQKHVCIEKHDSCSGRGIKYLTCPKSETFSENCIEKNDILKFCLRLLVEGEEVDKICIQPKPYITCENKSTTKLSVSPTETVKSTTATTKNEVTTVTTFSTSTTKDILFKINSFDVIYNTSYSGIAVWQVNSNESFETCNLILTLTYADSRKMDIVFTCSNNSYTIKNFNDLQEICLQSKDETKCRHSFVDIEEANAYKTKDHGYKNSSLFALSILLVVVFVIIISIVLRNLLKKRLDRDRYNVYIEEQNVQKRSSTLNQEPSVRYSYVPKE